MATKKKWTPSSDAKWDKTHNVKPGSAKDNKLDKERGVPTRKGKKKS